MCISLRVCIPVSDFLSCTQSHYYVSFNFIYNHVHTCILVYTISCIFGSTQSAVYLRDCGKNTFNVYSLSPVRAFSSSKRWESSWFNSLILVNCIFDTFSCWSSLTSSFLFLSTAFLSSCCCFLLHTWMCESKHVHCTCVHVPYTCTCIYIYHILRHLYCNTDVILQHWSSFWYWVFFYCQRHC